jgi:hypothetical protein
MGCSPLPPSGHRKHTALEAGDDGGVQKKEKTQAGMVEGGLEQVQSVKAGLCDQPG